MKKLLIAGVALTALIGPPALAADMPLKAPAPPPAPVWSWTGFYIGVNAGGAWGRSDTNSPLANIVCPVCYIPSVVTDINAQAHQRVNTSGFTGGVQAGYNVQFGSLVAGVEADYNALNLKGTTTTSAPFTGFPVPPGGVAPTYTNSVSTNWLFTGRGRLGFTPTNSLLLYGTGGVAFTNFKYTHTYAEGVFPGTSSGVEAATVTSNRAGYAVGGGLEYMLAANWSVKAEYLYMNFGTINTGPAPVIFPGPTVGGSVFTHSANLAVNVARVGIDYHFH
jgi:outer membrane immunogenic protein